MPLLLLVAHAKTTEKMEVILTKVRFLYAADLLGCMLHRFLSIAAVKTVCCHIAILLGLRGELKCDSFQLYIWLLKV